MIILLLFSFSGTLSYAQNDTVSISGSLSARIDSLDFVTFQRGWLDSLKRKFPSKTDTLIQKQKEVKGKLDELDPNRGIGRINQKIDSLSPQDKIDRVNKAIDSAFRLPTPPPGTSHLALFCSNSSGFPYRTIVNATGIHA